MTSQEKSTLLGSEFLNNFQRVNDQLPKPMKFLENGPDYWDQKMA